MFEKLDIKDIILIFLVLAVIYLIYRTKDIGKIPKTSEGFDTIDSIKKAVNDQYKADIDSIRNIASISKKIMDNPAELTLPANINIPGTTDIKGNTHIQGSLKIDGDVMFTNKNNKLMDILPRGIILASWAANWTLPKGWAICNGNSYKLDANNNAIVSIDSDAIQTPDLRSRFIVGAGDDDKYNHNINDYGRESAKNRVNHPFGSWGGEENHTLSVDEMPAHMHNFGRDHWSWDIPSYKGVDLGNINNQFANDLSGETTSNGGNKPHNNMPPYFALYYIMKL